MTILGISAFYHDSAAAIIQDGTVLAAAQEERFTRKKHDAAFPINAIKYCLLYAGRSLNEVDAVVFYEKPFLKFERLLETYYSNAPRGLRSFLTSMPVWIKEKMFLKKIIRDQLSDIDKKAGRKVKLLFPEHHLSHAASAFYVSPFEKAAIVTIDGVGEWATTSICVGEGNKITVLKELNFPHSLGLLYSAFTYFCGFRVNSGEYKLMGLAPYGNPHSEQVSNYIKLIKEHLVELKEDGSIHLDQRYFNYATGLRMVHDQQWEKLFGFPKRTPESFPEQQYCDLALAIQQVTEEIVIKLATEAKRITGADYLCMAGGVALNCVANGKLDNTGIFKQIFVQPAAGDAGGALGAACAGYYIYFDGERKMSPAKMDGMEGALLGPAYTDTDIAIIIRKYKAAFEYFHNEDELLNRVALLVAEGHVVGWHQGRMEFGPRALGARSIIADARNPYMQKKLNEKIKLREGFRPFAPVVLAEDVADYFTYDGTSPYMALVKKVKPELQISLPADFEKKDLLGKLYFQRSSIPAVTHIDYTARIQTLHRETNTRFWKLLKTFKDKTGCAVMINTSFNVRGEPIVNTPEEAYNCFMRTDMDFLVAGNYLFDKKEQPVMPKDNWQLAGGLD
ncbi:carbamoyltransferase family protein [Niastella populi]|uniref:Carbamoyltransferase n=1 Tax=Niastella populi TaxID=550983 RepID=A0A1V9FCK1_9BACT|nr:carbamoyltransferase [Niastella populi]OQP56113.1 hypothetical protein A4R26_26730 [Niastella populi]